jgi:hypothetical protein
MVARTALCQLPGYNAMKNIRALILIKELFLEVDFFNNLIIYIFFFILLLFHQNSMGVI